MLRRFDIASSRNSHPVISINRNIHFHAHANHIIDHAIAYAKRQSLSVTVVIVSSEGSLICSKRMDQAFPASSQIAYEKARTAALFRNPTSNHETSIVESRAALLSSGYTLISGGIPLVVSNRIVGAIGVSGATPTQDHEIAQLGSRLAGQTNSPLDIGV